MKVKVSAKEFSKNKINKPLKVKWTQQVETDVNFDIIIEILKEKIKNKEKITIMEYSTFVELMKLDKMDNFYYNNVK